MLTSLLQGFENIHDLVENAILLLALLLLYQTTNIDVSKTHKHKQVTVGIIIGLFMILVISNPWMLIEGIIFDTRTILMGVTGLFFGPIVTVIAGLIGAAYRISIGGPGVFVGVINIALSGVFGLFWYKSKHIFPKMPAFIEYYVFGFILHTLVLLVLFLLPVDIRWTAVTNNLIPFLGVFPVVTAILAIVLINHRNRLQSHLEIDKKQLLLQASIDSAKSIEIYTIDQAFNYLSFNAYHQHKIKNLYLSHISAGLNSLDFVDNEISKKAYSAHVKEALKGTSLNVMTESLSKKDVYHERIYEPLIDKHGDIIGVTIFVQDITDEKRYENDILKASYYDALTDLFNRRYFNQAIDTLNDDDGYLPLSIVMADINGLKIMNDAFGHSAGDELLCLVADIFRKCMPEKAIISRTGGDEFTTILPKTTHKEAKKIVQLMSSHLASETLYGIKISVSFGVSTKIDQEDIATTIRQAEDAMYRHKLFEIASHRSQSIKTILNALRAKNPREEQHSNRVSSMCEKIGHKLDLSHDDINLLKMISNLHDIGKIAIDDEILNKPGKLTEEEWQIIKRHPELGYRIVLTSPEYTEIAEDILSHHERYDGKGYPRGLKGDEIPLRAKIISVCDAYDAMTNNRTYREALSHQEAIEEIMRCKGTQFDPQITELFLELFKEGIPQ